MTSNKGGVGEEDGRNNVCAGRECVSGTFCSWLLTLPPECFPKSYCMISRIVSGCLEDVIIDVTPPFEAISAATSLLSMPPVPRLEPRLVETIYIIR